MSLVLIIGLKYEYSGREVNVKNASNTRIIHILSFYSVQQFKIVGDDAGRSVEGVGGCGQCGSSGSTNFGEGGGRTRNMKY